MYNLLILCSQIMIFVNNLLFCNLCLRLALDGCGKGHSVQVAVSAGSIKCPAAVFRGSFDWCGDFKLDLSKQGHQGLLRCLVKRYLKSLLIQESEIQLLRFVFQETFCLIYFLTTFCF